MVGGIKYHLFLLFNLSYGNLIITFKMIKFDNIIYVLTITYNKLYNISIITIL